MNLVVIVGSTRQGRFGPVVAEWFTGHARQRAGLTVEVVDLVHGEPGGEALRAADMFVVVTPEYNHSFPGPLKTAIDRHVTPWQAKPVGFVSYGGISGGLRAVEHLRQVFAELHAVTVRETVSFVWAQGQFGDDGRPLDPGPCGAAADRLLDQLTWWGRALASARRAHPYGVPVA
ncbi:NAD(P)H-dependent oxidoreductase [Herbidospora sp. NBRC 101105]|uniref:NADPH-dependent FMN reductase n=1 Tax=Herbidospora sp. NBRC 101105 TaxID=3032195 RepID=UPI0024A33B04|nr:NAD(P)H-dependent oxidoreductase [Herbidospora sp. NBRC 101105]GLX94414.1 FMN reductase [Herbidospora sp. NBRC 101105]